MRIFVPLFALMLLAGCALPPALTIASAALTGTSYLATGKSPTDHVLSAATKSDCNFMRALATVPRTPLCVGHAPAAVAAAGPDSTINGAVAYATAELPVPVPVPMVVPAEPGRIAAIAPAAGPTPDITTMSAAAMVLPTDAAAAIALAIARRDARAAEDALMASLMPAPAMTEPIDYVAEAEMSSAVIAAIAAHPEAVSAIVAAAVRAAPKHRATIAARASAAFPGFAAAIAQAATRPTA